MSFRGVLVFLFVGTFSAQAFSWEKVLSCNDDSLVIDVEYDRVGHAKYQMVLRNHAYEHFKENRAIPSFTLTEKKEAVIPVSRNKHYFDYFYFTYVFMQLEDATSTALYEVERAVRGEPGIKVKYTYKEQDSVEYFSRDCKYFREP